MEKNKNNQNRTEETSKPTNQPETNREKITPEIDPNNPTARRDKQNGSIQDNQNPKDKTNPTLPKTHLEKGETTAYDKDRTEEIVYGTDTESKSIKLDSKKEENEVENPYNKEGNL